MKVNNQDETRRFESEVLNLKSKIELLKVY
jgi:hypothetical protein